MCIAIPAESWYCISHAITWYLGDRDDTQ